MKQNTQEWHDLRSVSIGASDCPIIMQSVPSSWGTPLELWERKLGIRGPKAMNFAMQRGVDNEKRALELVESLLCVKLRDEVLIAPDRPWQIASLDGWNADKRIAVEIKCLGKKGWDEAGADIIPRYYQWQMQHQMCVAGIDQVVYAVYYEDDIRMVTLKRNQQEIDELIEAEEIFYECMQSGTAPSLTAKDRLDIRNDADFYTLEQELCTILHQIDMLETRSDALKQEIKTICDGKNVRGNFLMCTHTNPKGRIQYERIPELKEVNLEEYRGLPSSVTTIKRIK